ncbi:ubiquinone/menaquinone biosynthesis methyltransferase [bacterium]|nr:ubiquinone/menaquinone biosynthesis methyltransferase [bacterium]MBU1065190.1 ubiquinone/menaquinone biosynthesis methyltransferase [bacterium]MBU1635174.1 ubiquinone/menaquinone biosynthesis methyltransferase [bacterium]MBU1872689.1 ubiquinone/menaquinone biosynthesis methyltransferase [bacterium]
MNKGIQKIFAEVPKTYELVNHVLTFGFDILWRKKAVKIAVHQGGTHWLDVCTGTGETANYLTNHANTNTKVYATDFSLPMLTEATQKPNGKRIHFTLSDVKQLPFPDNTFDLVTISFATRNLNTSRETLESSFREFHRILKPGGLFVNLETSQPQFFIIRKLFHLFIKIFVKPIGSLISGSNAGYAYLSRTIPRFYSTEELASILKASGFQNVYFTRMLFGAAAIHQSLK